VDEETSYPSFILFKEDKDKGEGEEEEKEKENVEKEKSVMIVDQVPRVVQLGMRAIAMTWDVCGISKLVNDALKKAWKSSEGSEGQQTMNEVDEEVD
jgi:hypothetical protein